MRFLILAASLGLLAGCGGGPPMAKVKGRVVDGGKPIELPTGTQAAVTFTPVKDGAPDNNASRSAVMETDGTFELHESGGQVMAGKFHVSLLVTGKAAEKYRTFASPASSPLRAELKAGANDIVIDLSKPNG